MIEEIFGLFREAKEQGWLNPLLDAVRTKHRILITGETGAGKTQLRQSLGDLQAKVIHESERTRAPVTERIRIHDQIFDFVDLPGQREHRHLNETVYARALNDGLGGVLNVVSHGYHEYPQGRSRAVTGDTQPDPDFLAQHRLAEMQGLDLWRPIRTMEPAPWVVTVVTKADLWWPEWPAVQRHYAEGPYAERLHSDAHVHHIVIPYVSVFHRFYGSVPMSGLVGDDERSRFRADLFRTLLELIGKGHLPGNRTG